MGVSFVLLGAIEKLVTVIVRREIASSLSNNIWASVASQTGSAMQATSLGGVGGGAIGAPCGVFFSTFLHQRLGIEIGLQGIAAIKGPSLLAVGDDEFCVSLGGCTPRHVDNSQFVCIEAVSSTGADRSVAFLVGIAFIRSVRRSLGGWFHS